MKKVKIFLGFSIILMVLLMLYPLFSIGSTLSDLSNIQPIDCSKYTTNNEKLICNYFNVLVLLFTSYIKLLSLQSPISFFNFNTPTYSLTQYVTPNYLVKESGVIFKFQYHPEKFRVEEGGYKTPGGYRFPLISIKKINGDTKDVIYISGKTLMSTGPEISCQDKNLTRCVEVDFYILRTESNDKEVFDEFEIVKSSLSIESFERSTLNQGSYLTVISPNGGEK